MKTTPPITIPAIDPPDNGLFPEVFGEPELDAVLAEEDDSDEEGIEDGVLLVPVLIGPVSPEVSEEERLPAEAVVVVERTPGPALAA